MSSTECSHQFEWPGARELAFGAGYSSAEGVIGDISVAERNGMGEGQWLRLPYRIPDSHSYFFCDIQSRNGSHFTVSCSPIASINDAISLGASLNRLSF